MGIIVRVKVHDLPAQAVRRHVLEDGGGVEGAAVAAGHEAVLAEKDDLGALRHTVGIGGKLFRDQEDLHHDVFPVFLVGFQVRKRGRLKAGGLPFVEICRKAGRVSTVTVNNGKDSSHNCFTSGSKILRF